MNFPIKICISALTLSFAACASYETSTIHFDDPSNYAHQGSSENVAIGVKAMTDDAETKVAFDENLIREGIYPIQVSVKNVGQNTIMIVRDKIELIGETTQAVRPINAVSVAEEVEDDAMTDAILGFGIFSYAAAKDANEERRADYVSKQLPDELVLRPGRTDGGFVFFKLAEGDVPTGKKLTFLIEELGTGNAPYEVEVAIH